MTWHWPHLRMRPALWLLLVCVVVGLAQGMLIAATDRLSGLSERPALLLQLTGAVAAWAALPIVLTVVVNAAQLTQDRHGERAWLRWFGFVLLHLGGYLAFSVAHVAAIRILRGLVGTTPDGSLGFRLLWEMQNDLVVYAAAASVLTMVRSFRERDEAARRSAVLEAKLAETHLAALTAQLDPHFFYNALNTISALMHEDLEKTERLLASLGSVMRTTLKGGAATWSLAEERAHTERYLELLLARFGERLSFEWRAEPGLEHVEVPRYAVQTLVENSVKHNASRVGTLAVNVDVRRVGNSIEVTVEDDGIGFANSPLLEGHGLTRLAATLELLHDRAGRLKRETREGGGASVVVQVPA